MIRDCEKLRNFEKDRIANRLPDPGENFRIAEALYKEAVALGVFPMEKPLDGIDVDIRIARAVNRV